MLLSLALAALAAPPETDRHSFPLPAGAVARLGSSALRGAGHGFDLTPDGKTLLTAGSQRWVDGDEVKLWDAAGGKLLRSFPHRWARTVVVSADGKRVAVLGVGDGSYWNLETGERVWNSPAELRNKVSAVAIAPDGKLVALGGDDVVLVDADNGAVLRTIKRRQRSNSLSAVAFSPDGSLVAAEDQYELRLWEVATGNPVRTLDGNASVNGLAFTPDGKRLLAGVWSSKDKGVPVWDVATGKRVQTLDGHQDYTAAVAVSPDGKWAATAGGPSPFTSDRTTGPDHDIHVYDLATGERRHVLPGMYTAAAGLKFTPDSKTLVTGDAVVRFWDVASGKRLRPQEGHEEHVTDVRFAGDTLVTAGLDGTVRGWNPRTGEQLRVDRVGHGPPTDVVLSEDATRVCVVTSDGMAVASEVATGKELGRVKADRYRPLQFTPAGDALLVLNHENITRLPFGGRPVTRPGPGGPQWASGLSPDGTVAWSVESVATKEEAEEYDKRSAVRGPGPPFDLVLRNLETGIVVGRFRTSGASSGGRAVWSPDGRLVAVGDYGVSVWEPATGKTLAAFDQGSSLSAGPTWSPDGKRIAYTRDGTLSCRDTATGRLLFELPLGSARSHRLAWSPDGKLLAAATGTTVLVYEVPAGR